VLAWDIINEPEWAMTGPSTYGGDPPFEPTPELEPLSHAEMETLLSDIAGVLRSESTAQITVGSAAVKWAHAWTQLELDFYQFHYYAWVNDYWPYTDPPITYGLDRPIVLGEFPLGELDTGIGYQTVVDNWWTNGYAGAWSWMYDGAMPADLGLIDPFSQAHSCETHF